MGIVCPGQCMAAPAFPILVANEIGFFLIGVLPDKVRINRQPAIRIRAALRQEGVHFIFGDKAVMFLPCKFIPRLIRHSLAGELLKLLQHAIRRIIVEAHQRRILSVDRRQPFKTLVQVCHILRRIQPLSKTLCHFGKSALEYGQIVKESLRHAIGQVTFHIGHHFCVFFKCVVTCRVQHHLGCILALSEQLPNPGAHIQPGEKRFLRDFVLYGMTGGDLHPQLIPPNRIILAVNDKALAADAVFTLYKLRGFLRRRVGHKVINQPELASVPIAATAQHFVHHGCGNGNLPRIQRRLPFLNGAALTCHRWQFGQR